MRTGLIIVILTGFFSTTCVSVNAQSTDDRSKQLIKSLDSTFWVAYNKCDIDGMFTYIDNDVEFYHDKSGITKGKNEFRKAVQNGLCGQRNWRLRRAAVDSSIKVFLLKSNDSLYGAVFSGQHLFYIQDADKPEYLDGLARFHHVWLRKNGKWVMSRIVSYDHGPARVAD